MKLFSFIFAIFSTFFVGKVILDIITFYTKERRFCSKECISYSFALGFLSIGLQMFMYSQMQLSYNLLNILMPWFLFSLIFYRKEVLELGLVSLYKRLLTIQIKHGFFLFAFLALLAVLLFAAHRLSFIWSWDAIALWGFKAKVFFYDGIVKTEFFLDKNTIFLHPEYPIGFSLFETYLYLFLGEVNESWANMISPVFFMLYIPIFYDKISRKKLSGLGRVISVFILLSVPYYFYSLFTGYADISFSLLLSLALFAVGDYFLEQRRQYLIISMLLAAGTSWIKQEGLIFFLLFSFAVMISLYKEGQVKDLLKALWASLGAALVFIAPWSIFVFVNKISSTYFSDLIVAIKRIGFERFTFIISSFVVEFCNLQNWNILFVSVALVFMYMFLKKDRENHKQYFFEQAIIIAMFFTYVAAYCLSPCDLRWHMGTSLSRLLLHFTPLLVFNLSVVFGD